MVVEAPLRMVLVWVAVLPAHLPASPDAGCILLCWKPSCMQWRTPLSVWCSYGLLPFQPISLNWQSRLFHCLGSVLHDGSHGRQAGLAFGNAPLPSCESCSDRAHELMLLLYRCAFSAASAVRAAFMGWTRLSLVLPVAKWPGCAPLGCQLMEGPQERQRMPRLHCKAAMLHDSDRRGIIRCCSRAPHALATCPS